MRRFAAAGALVASAAFFAAAAPAAAAEPVRLLDVPFVPQSEALCGGASLAMVLRYWGEPGVLAEEFAPLMVRGEGGISGDSLVAAVTRRGWSAFPIAAARTDVQDHLARGRPLIARIDAGSKVAHYVVLLGWANGGVVLHDPALGPFQVEREEDFARAWEAAGRWALLVMPAPGMARAGAGAAPEPDRAPAPGGEMPPPPPPDTTAFDAPAIPDIAGRPPITGCDSLVSEGVRKARRGADAEAAGLLSAAASLCPASAAPVRELAGLRFRAKDYRAAAFLAQRALVLEPDDKYTWRLLAGSRYLSGDVKGALDAWNRLGEPKTDLTRVDGLRRMRYEAVADQVDLPPGYLLTWDEYRRADRRLSELPAASQARLRLTPLPQGGAQVNVAVVERPLLFDGFLDAGMAAARAAASSEVVLRLSSPMRLGERWTARWRFRANRPRVVLALDAPALIGRPGLWHVEGAWERQAYSPPGLPASAVFRQERRRGAVTFADWISPDWRVELGGAVDRFGAPGASGVPILVSPEAAVEARSMGDRLSLRASGAAWAHSSLHAFSAGELLARFGSDDFASGDWLARAGFAVASDGAPLALWPGASTGSGRGALLRAHPLLDGGIVTGRVFGQRLLHGGLERRVWPWEVKPLRIGFAVFADAARIWRPLVAADVPLQVDVGAGLRLAGGKHGELRADFGYGLEDGETAISVGLGTH